MKPEGGWPILEILLDTSPQALSDLLTKYDLYLVETKKGLQVRLKK
jgi:hypothetical protein